MSIESLKQQARKHEQNEDWKKALEQYKKALAELAREEQVDIGLYNRVGDLYVRIGGLDDAVEHYEKAVDLYREAYLPNNAIAVCKKIIRNVPDRHKAYLQIGQIRAEQGFLSDARTQFLTYAERMQQAGQLDESFRALIEFCDLAPDDVGVRVTVAEQMAAQGMSAEAVEQLTVAHRHFAQLGEVDQAAEIEAKIREIDPEADVAALSSADAYTPSTVSDDGEIVADFGDISLDDDAFGQSAEEKAGDDIAEAMEESAAAAAVEQPEVEIEADLGGFEIAGAEDEDPEEAAAAPLPMMDFDDDDDGDALELPTLDFTEDEAAEGDAPALPTLDAAEDDDEVDAPALPTIDLAEDDEVDAPALPTMDFAEDDAPALPTLDFAEDDAEDDAPALPTLDFAEDDASELPTMDFGDDETDAAPLPTMDFGDDGDAGPTEEEAIPLPTMDFGDDDAPAVPDADVADVPGHGEESVVFEEIASGDGAEGVGAADAAELPTMDFDSDVGISDAVAVGGDSAEVIAEAVEEAASDPAPVEDTAPAEVVAASVDQPAEAETAPAEAPPAPSGGGDGYVDLGAMILGGPSDAEKSTRFTVAYEEPSGDEEADFAKMLSQFKEKVSENLDSSDVRAHYDLGTAYKEMGLLDEAISSFQAALRASSDHLPTYELMGQTFMEMEQPEAAVRCLERALESASTVEDELVGIYYHLGAAYEKLENRESAVEFYERVFALDINFADVTERLRELR